MYKRKKPCHLIIIIHEYYSILQLYQYRFNNFLKDYY